MVAAMRQLLRRLLSSRTSMKLGLRNRLLLWLLLPLCILALVGAWVEYLWADAAAISADQRLQRLLVPLADSVLVPYSPNAHDSSVILLLAPPVEEFVRQGEGLTGFSVWDLSGKLLLGDERIKTSVPQTMEPEFHSIESDQVLYRVAVQRGRTPAGELVVAVADGSDPRQHWGKQVLWRVLLPNLVLLACAALAIHWGVRIAFKPLVDLTEDVERRSPRDLSPIEDARSPLEVRPLVHSLNHLFGLVDAQAESQRRFIADAAHQLRTPLAGLQSQVEAWALMGENSGNVSPGGAKQVCLSVEQIDKLREAARRTSKLAHQLLTLSRVDERAAGQRPTQWLNLKPLCEETLESLLDAAMAKGLDLGLEAGPVLVRGHDWLLRELLINLVDNAIKYSPIGSSVTIRCALRQDAGPDDRTAILQVEDDGLGIAPEERAKAMERFYRVTETSGEGSGLGLAIANEIARLHGATMTLDTGLRGRGLLVTVSFS